MTKQKLQQELKEKVKEGIKPSHLKRSKSLGDIPKAPPLPNTLCQRCDELQKQLDKLNDDWTSLAQQRVENLKATPNPRIAELEKELEQTVKDATEEINKLEDQNKQLKTKLTQVNDKNQDLTREVNSYQRAAELRINEPIKAPNYNWWTDYGPVILLFSLYALSVWLLKRNTKYE